MTGGVVEKIKHFVGWMLILMLGASEAGARTPCESALMGKLHREEVETAKLWRATGLKSSYLFKKQILGPQCTASRDNFVDCVVLLDGIARKGSPAYALMPKAVLSQFGEVIEPVEDFGFLQLVRIDENWTAHRWGSLRKDNEKLVERKKAYIQALERGFRKNIDFEAMTQKVLAKVLTRDREAMQVAAGLTDMMQLSDSHAAVRSLGHIIKALAEGGTQALDGVGAIFEFPNQKITVTQVLPRSPAAKADLRVGDQILMVNGWDQNQLEANDLVDSIRGPRGTTVKIKVLRHGEAVELTITRGPVVYKNVQSELLGSARGIKTGFMKLRSFESDHGCSQVKAEIRRLVAKGAQQLIFDLRENGGGSVDQAQCISGLFLGEQVIARQKSLATGEVEDIRANHQKITDLPLVVLINSSSASASELTSGALRYYERAWLMGERSFGKGSVQGPVDLEPEDDKTPAPLVSFYRTIAHFYQPDGTSNQLNGIVPNFIEPKVPGGKIDEQTILREEDISPNAIPAEGKKWRETRTSEIQALRKCMDQQGQAVVRYQKLFHEGQNVDYRVERAMDLLDCMAP